MIPKKEDLEFFEYEIQGFVESLEGGTLAFPDWALNESAIHWRRIENRQRMFMGVVSVYFLSLIFLILFLIRK